MFREFLWPALLAASPLAVAAQTSVAANATLASNYVWRGVTFTNASVVQPRASVTRSGSLGSVGFSASGNVEPTTAAAPNAIRQGGSHAGLNELDLAAQWGRPFAGATLTAGWIGYRFSEESTSMSDIYNTDEVWAGVRLDSLPFSPSIAAYHDVGVVGGTYLEGSLSRGARVWHQPTTFSVVAGWSAGQEQRRDSDAFYNFNRSGLTHVDLGATSTFKVGTLALTPTAHLQLSPAGQNTRVAGALPGNRNEALKGWVGFDIGWAR